MHDWKQFVRDRLAPLRLKPERESALVDELASHLNDVYQDRLRSGESEEHAVTGAMAAMGDIRRMEQELSSDDRMPKRDFVPMGDARRAGFTAGLLGDLRYAMRVFLHQPIFTLFIILTLALGIGANTAVFTVVNTLILHPLPVADSNLVSISARNTGEARALPTAFSDLADYRRAVGAFESIAAYTSPRPLTWRSQASSQTLFAEFVSANYFSTVGIRAMRGRVFEGGDRAPLAEQMGIVLNHGTWKTRFGGADDIVGKTLVLNGISCTVLGIAPPRFIGLNAVFGPDVWIPAERADQMLGQLMPGGLADRGNTVFWGVGRLRSGITKRQAEDSLAGIASALARENPATNGSRTALLRPIAEALFNTTGGSSASVVSAAVILLVVVAMVLLIACSNVANLLLARSAARQQEMAVRLAIGASRGRLLRQLLTESVLIGLFSGVAGLCVAWAVLRLLFSALPTSANFVSPHVDTAVLLYTVAVSLATGILFGIVPALQSSRTDVTVALKEESRTGGRSRRKVRLGRALMVVQVSFSCVLLVVAAMFLRSMQRAYSIDAGFDPDHLAVFTTNPAQAGLSDAQARDFYRAVRERVSQNPFVETVSWASNMPLWARPVSGLVIEGRSQRSSNDQVTTVINTVDRRYFEAAGIPILKGRDFDEGDRHDSDAVAIVNAKLAHDHWPNGAALGRRIQLPGEPRMRRVVGVTKTAAYTNWAEPPQACVYIPLQQTRSDTMVLYVRAKGNPSQVVAPVRREIAAANASIVIGGPLVGREIVDRGLFQARMAVALLTGFGLLALALASIGLYGLVAYSVHQRKREIGLRMALGAARGNILKLVVGEGLSLVAAGIFVGYGVTLLVAHVLRQMLFGVSPADPLSFAAAGLILAVVALVASYLPARSASDVEPSMALRER